VQHLADHALDSLIVGAEYVLGTLPKGTHQYDKFIKPSELAESLRRHHFEIRDLSGMRYNPFNRTCHLHDRVDVNYLVHAARD
jgi:2-polyprenyl-6-hydroxyphenyl methylase/3-demethylubiquinone-9 3-methyltransferase